MSNEGKEPPMAGDDYVLVPREQLSTLADLLDDNRTTTDSGLPVTVAEMIDVQQAAAAEIRALLASPPAAAHGGGDAARLDWCASKLTLWNGEKHVPATREHIDAARLALGGDNAPAQGAVTALPDGWSLRKHADGSIEAIEAGHGVVVRKNDDDPFESRVYDFFAALTRTPAPAGAFLSAAPRAAQAGECVICGAAEPYSGTCGSNDPRALCKQATPSQSATVQGVGGWPTTEPSYTELFNAISAATKPAWIGGAISVSVSAFLAAIATERQPEGSRDAVWSLR